MKESRKGRILTHLLRLRNTLGNPNKIARFLLLEFHVRVEYAKVELSIEGETIELHFVREEAIIHRTFFAGTDGIKELAILLMTSQLVG